VLLHLTSLFAAGEESVTVDLLPLLGVIAQEGRLEEEIYLDLVPVGGSQARRGVPPLPRRGGGQRRRPLALPLAELPGDLCGRVAGGPAASPARPIAVAQAEAAVTYNMIVEGVLAETGYNAYHAMLERNGILPGMQQTVDCSRRTSPATSPTASSCSRG